MIPYDHECVTRLLRRMPSDRLKTVRSTDFQRWPAQVVIKGKILDEMIRNEHARRAA